MSTSATQSELLAAHLSVDRILQLKRDFRSEPMQKRRVSLATHLHHNPDALDLDDTILAFFEDVAHLSQRGYIDDEDLWTMLSFEMTRYWAACRHYVYHIREEHSDYTLFEVFELLALELIKHEAQELEVDPKSLITADQVKSFLKMEMARISA